MRKQDDGVLEIAGDLPPVWIDYVILTVSVTGRDDELHRAIILHFNIADELLPQDGVLRGGAVCRLLSPSVKVG